ncbi:MAG TPA: hypothetical protein VIZ68_01630, partial [Thermoplasmata archaeon]
LVVATWLRVPGLSASREGQLIALSLPVFIILSLELYALLFLYVPSAVRVELGPQGIALVFPRDRRSVIPWAGEQAFLVIDHSVPPSPGPGNPTGRALLQKPLRVRTYISYEGFTALLREAEARGWTQEDRPRGPMVSRLTLRGPN